MGYRGQHRAAVAALALAVMVGAAPSPASSVAAGPVPWPGSRPMPADRSASLGTNLSGLASAGPERLWAVRDGPSALLLLQRTRNRWTVDGAWGEGRELRYPGGRGAPDAEGVTTTPLDPAAIFVGAERDNDRSRASRNSIVRYDTNQRGPLVATHEWALDPLLPASAPNIGVEAISWIPSDAVGPSGSGAAPKGAQGQMLFAIGTEIDGDIRIVSVGRDNADARLVASVPSGLPAIMALEWDAGRQALWALCDNGCGGSIVLVRNDGSGLRPALGLAAHSAISKLNHEGFAILPGCPAPGAFAVWSDDAATGGHALREARLPCSALVLPRQGRP